MASSKLLPKSSVHRALNTLGDRWGLLIIQQAFLGTSRFEEFRSRCEIPRSTLSNRLKALLASGVLEMRPHRSGMERRSYHLTKMGQDLLDSILSAWAWGIRWGVSSDGMPKTIIHHGCGKAMVPLLACDHCHGEITLRNCAREDGPGAGMEALVVQRMHRRRYAANEYFDSDVVDLIGDRWTGMVIAAQYFGVHRFDHLQASLHIASNILADRLKGLELNGILERRLYELMPPRYEYWLTKKGMDLFPHALCLMLWGDRWLVDDEGPPVVVKHKPCGHTLGASIVCGECGERLTIDSIAPKTQPRLSRANG